MKNLVGFLLLSVIVLSCKNSSENKGDNSTNDKLTKFYNKSDEVLDKPAKPSQISDLLTLSGAPLMKEKMNDPALWEQYTADNVKAAANMGIYLADAVVQFAYNEKKLAYNSAIAARSLAAQIGIADEVFMGYLIKDRYQEVGGQSDSLYFVLDSALHRADESLNADERFLMLAAMYVGNYIEKQYLVSNIIFEYPVDLPEDSKLLILRDMLVVLSNSLSRLDYIIEMVEEATKDGEGYLLKELKELKELHTQNKLTLEQVEKIKPEEVFENEGFIARHNKIVEIRDFIVGS